MNRGLIVFAKLPRAGEVKTRLGQRLGMERAAELYRQFAEHVFTVADQLAATGVRVFLFHAPGADLQEYRRWVRRPFTYVPQEGSNLGDRMRRAFDFVFASGLRQAAVIGTDVPELQGSAVLHAFDLLAMHDLVVGPSSDGGYYLLGMNAPTKNVFENIAWSSASVLRQTLERAHRQNLSCAVLDPLADIDTVEDYRAFLQRLEDRASHRGNSDANHS